MRGTDFSLIHPADIVTDLNEEGVGANQYVNNKQTIRKFINTGGAFGRVDLTGHSLGGALCQWTATDRLFKGEIGRVITFQSPGISQKAIDDYNSWDKKDQASEVIHHIDDADFVNYAGEAKMPGVTYTSNTYSGLQFAHLHLLLSSEEYRKQREELGITEDMIRKDAPEGMGFGDKVGLERHMLKKDLEDPSPYIRLFVEYERKQFSWNSNVEFVNGMVEGLQDMIDDYENVKNQLNNVAIEEIVKALNFFKEFQRMSL
jgi:hypothetical protein